MDVVKHPDQFVQRCTRGAHHPEPAGIGDGGRQLRRGEAGELERNRAASQLGEASSQHPSVPSLANGRVTA
jgi:hypothetical protein